MPKNREALATRVTLNDDTLTVELADGRSISAPIAWYPRLAVATPKERAKWRLIGGGHGIHWPAVDEDISVANLLAGQPSGESQISYKKWLAGRAKPGASRKREITTTPTYEWRNTGLANALSPDTRATQLPPPH